MKKGETEMPVFKYCSNPLKAGLFELSDEPYICECCRQETRIIYKGPFYSAYDISVLCPECIASGEASTKFDGSFVDYDLLSPDIPEDYKFELCHRSPSYIGLQQEYWIDHCGDFCDFIAYVGWKEVEAMGLENSISHIENVSWRYKENIINGGSCQGYLFRCLKCKRYILYADFD